MIKTTALAATHMECRNLQESLKVLTELLAFEKVSEKPGEVTLKHPNTHWKLVVHEAGPNAGKADAQSLGRARGQSRRSRPGLRLLDRT
jgi:hypothetical protein